MYDILLSFRRVTTYKIPLKRERDAVFDIVSYVSL